MSAITLHNGMIAQIDEQDFARISAFHWTAVKRRNRWYAIRSAGDRQILMHREVLGLGEVADPKLDHKDRDGLNNCRGNLREATASQNCANHPGNVRRTSQFKGVSVFRGGKWLARITKAKRVYCLGVFATQRAAAISYNRAARRLFGEFAYLNEL